MREVASSISMVSADAVASAGAPAATADRDPVAPILQHIESAEVGLRVAHQALASTVGAIRAATAALAADRDAFHEGLGEDFASQVDSSS